MIEFLRNQNYLLLYKTYIYIAHNFIQFTRYIYMNFSKLVIFTKNIHTLFNFQYFLNL